MGIMPVDRDQKWQRIFRRFGLPGDMPEKEPAARDRDRASKQAPEAPARDKRTGKQSDR